MNKDLAMISSEGKHVMLSYNHKSKDIVKTIYDALRAENIPVWYDEMNMDANLYDGMAAAVCDATVVCCFMSPDYENSKNCKLELEHAQRLDKRIIPCMMTNRKVWKPSPTKWLSLITGSTIAIDFSDSSKENIVGRIEELVDRLRKESVTVSTRSDKLFEPLRRAYLEQNRLKRIMNEEKSFPIDQSYINLSMVETKEQQEKEKKLKSDDENNEVSKPPKDAILGTYEEIYGVKTSIDVSEIFAKCKDSIKKVLVLGRAGIGKSTFCQYVTYRWAEGVLWTQYELVVLIRLRRLTESRYSSARDYSPMDLVEKEYFPFPGLSNAEEECFKEYFRTSKILWILDGYDEFAQNIPNQLKDVFDHILQTQHHILTSRPYTIALSYETKMEIIGFTDENIAKYVEHFFDEIKEEIPNALAQGANLLRFLRSNMSIWGVAHIPVNLELICSLWSDTDWSKKKTLTMTMLYENMTEWLCRRYLQKKNIDTTQMRKKLVYAECDKELQFFETLAFNAMEFNDIILPATLLEQTEEEIQCNLDRHPQMLNFGVLKLYDDKATGRQNLIDKQYYFTHLSFQEYFAARRLLGLLKSTQKQKASDFIGRYKYNRRFLYVFIFASGLLAQSEYMSCLQEFWTTLEDEPLDLVGLSHIKLIIECLDETEGRALFPQSTDHIRSISNWIESCVNERPSAISDYLFQSLARTQSIGSNMMLQRKLMTILQANETVIKIRILHLLSEMRITEPTPELIDQLKAYTEHTDAEVRQRACNALGNITPHKRTNEVIQALITALNDKHYFVGNQAFKALVVLGERAATKEVIDALILALNDRNHRVRERVCAILRELGEKAATAGVIDALVTALNDQSYPVRERACGVLAELGAKAATKEVIHALIGVLYHENDQVKRTACEILRQLGDKAATKEVIDALIIALNDPNSSIGLWACQALGQLGEKAATKHVIDALITVLNHEDQRLVRKACQALCQLGAKAATNEVTDALIIALSHKNDQIRERACGILGQLGAKAATKQVIDALMTTLNDQSGEVRKMACEVLGQLGAKAATNEAIQALIIALNNDDHGVRRKACQAISQLGDKAATKEVINALIVLRDDQNSEVRKMAGKSLSMVGPEAATKEVIQTLVDALKHENGVVRKIVCGVLSQVGAKTATKEVIHALITAVNDENGEVREMACEALSQLGDKAATNEVIDTLIFVLNHENGAVREKACQALGQLSAKVATKQAIDALIVALEDENDSVRRMACDVFGLLGEKAAKKEVIQALIIALNNGDYWLRRKACQALGQLGEKAATKEAIKALIVALKDENAEVRRIACEVLSQLGAKTATTDVIQALITVLNNGERWLKQKACQALGQLGELAATNEVIQALLITLNDQDDEVRERACQALGQLGEKAATKEVIDALIVALKDETGEMREMACEVLGQLGEKAPRKEVIQALIIALNNENYWGRRKACEGLGQLGEKAATNEVIEALIVAVNDQHGEVRRMACEALGRLGDKAATNEVIQALITVLNDQNGEIRKIAGEVLSQIGAKTATTEVINALIAALNHEDGQIRERACGVLGQLSAKKEVIGALIVTLNDESDHVRRMACGILGQLVDETATPEVIERFLVGCFTRVGGKGEAIGLDLISRVGFPVKGMKVLDDQILRKLYAAIEKNTKCDLTMLRPYDLLELYLETKNEACLPLITYGLLLQGAAVTFVEKENKLVIYNANEVLERIIVETDLRDVVMDSLKRQKRRLGKSH